MDELHNRINNHRCRFKLVNSDYEKSAAPLHIFNSHIELFDNKLKNFHLGIIKTATPINLERLEDYYIWYTRADVIGLNRYKHTR